MKNKFYSKWNISLIKPWIFIFLFYFFLAVAGHGCPILLITGISCPGCGLSRAYLALLQGNLKLALHFHPLFWGVPVLFIAAWRWNVSKSTVSRNLFILFGGTFFLVYLLRLLAGDPALFAAPSQGLIYKAFAFIYSLIQKQ